MTNSLSNKVEESDLNEGLFAMISFPSPDQVKELKATYTNSKKQEKIQPTKHFRFTQGLPTIAMIASKEEENGSVG